MIKFRVRLFHCLAYREESTACPVCMIKINFPRPTMCAFVCFEHCLMTRVVFSCNKGSGED